MGYDMEIISSLPYKRRLMFRNDKNLMSYRGIGVKNKFNATNSLWNDKYFNVSRNIGCLSVIIKCAAYYYYNNGLNKSLYDLTLEQFYYYYFEISPIFRLDIDVPDEYCGRTKKEIIFLAKDLQLEALSGDKYGNKFNLTDEEALAYVLIRVLDQTYEGYINELKMAVQIQNILPDGAYVLPSTGKDDIDSGVDFYIVTAKNELLTAIQIKPISFFIGINRDYIIRAIKEHDKKHNDFSKKWGINIYYVTEENGLLYSVMSKPNINLKENLIQDLQGILYEVESRMSIV